jgi:hypothetical protein
LKKSIILFALAQFRLKPNGILFSRSLAKAAVLISTYPLAEASGN